MRIPLSDYIRDVLKVNVSLPEPDADALVQPNVQSGVQEAPAGQEPAASPQTETGAVSQSRPQQAAPGTSDIMAAAERMEKLMEKMESLMEKMVMKVASAVEEKSKSCCEDGKCDDESCCKN